MASGRSHHEMTGGAPARAVDEALRPVFTKQKRATRSNGSRAAAGRRTTMEERVIRYWWLSLRAPAMVLVRNVRGMKAFRVLVLAILFVACFPRIAAASHLQGGTIYWERDVTFNP